MSVIGVFSIYDSAVKAFAQPFFAPTKGAAIRMFSDLTNDSQSAVSKHPGDYSLHGLAMYDDVTGHFEPFPSPERIITAQEVLTDK